jgi:hypothetical protein
MDTPNYEILSKKCLSSQHTAFIPEVLNGSCQCGNCKIRVRQHRALPKDAWHEIPKYHDYVFDVEEVLKIRKDNLTI